MSLTEVEPPAGFGIPEHVMRLAVEALGLGPIATKALGQAGIRVLGDLEGRSRQFLEGLDGLGKKRLDRLETAIEDATRLPPTALARMTRPDEREVRVPSLPVEMLQAIASARSMKAEAVALTTGLSDRDARLFLSRLGRGGKAPTLEELGESEGITRERVRQLVVRHNTLLEGSALRLPIASRLVELVDSAEGMLTTTQLVHLAAEHGIEVTEAELGMLPALAALGLTPHVEWSQDFRVWLTDKGRKRWLETGRLTHHVRGLRRLARAALRRVGAAPMAEYLAKSGMGERQIQEVLAPAGSRLAVILGYMVPQPSPDSALTRIATKMLAVGGGLGLRELHAGLTREPRLRPVPPPGVVRAVFANHPAFVVRGNSVSLREELSERGVLSGAEYAAVNIFRAGSGVMHTYEFIDLMSQAGYSPPRAAQILHGALVSYPATGVHVLRGFRPPPGAIERKIEDRRSRRSPAILSSVPDARGRLVVTYRLGRYNLDGVLAPPPDLGIDRESWKGTDGSGRTMNVTIRNGFLWGIREWLIDVSAAEGDGIVATFDPDRGEVEFDFLRGAPDEE
ncbi:MAG TPA: hypothetical protein VLH75_20100 [Longimicrobiales bacterium]|nr:hypothetical protein [Longimicrobiales bacterium]